MKDPETLMPVRELLLTRLSNWDNPKGWRDFFEIYWQLIYEFALREGLTEQEALDVVQETIRGIVSQIESLGSNGAPFKTWLLRQTESRISEQFARRTGSLYPSDSENQKPHSNGHANPAPRIPEGLWNEEYHNSLVSAATERVKKSVDARQYQVFDLYVYKKWPAGRVARALNINTGKVYLAKHRVSQLIRKELALLQPGPPFSSSLSDSNVFS